MLYSLSGEDGVQLGNGVGLRGWAVDTSGDNDMVDVGCTGAGTGVCVIVSIVGMLATEAVGDDKSGLDSEGMGETPHDDNVTIISRMAAVGNRLSIRLVIIRF